MALAALQTRLVPPTPQAPAACRRAQQQLAVGAAVGDRLWLPSRHPCAAARRQRRQRWQGCRLQQALGQQPRRLQPAALQTEAPSQGMPAEEAWALLAEFTSKEARGLAQPFLNDRSNRQRLRDALLVAAAAPHVPAGWNPAAGDPPEVLLGVVASEVRLAVRALRDYCAALGLPFRVPESRVPGAAAAPAISGPVYIKYNSASGLCYASAYEGQDRGVLVQLGQQQFGHLPLGMFDEGMANPAPRLG